MGGREDGRGSRDGYYSHPGVTAHTTPYGALVHARLNSLIEYTDNKRMKRGKETERKRRGKNMTTVAELIDDLLLLAAWQRTGKRKEGAN